MRVASGWDVSREAYTGYTVKSHLLFSTHDGGTGRLVVRGTPYVDGVVLYEPRAEGASKALCVVSLACAPRPDDNGQWDAQQRAWAWIRMLVVAAAAGWVFAKWLG